MIIAALAAIIFSSFYLRESEEIIAHDTRTSEESYSCINTLHSLIDRGLIDDSLRYRFIGAIMITESGVEGSSRPSQYVMNFGGKSARFTNKDSALQYLSSRDDTNVDIGCMQINLAAHCKEYMGSCTKESRLQMAEKLFDKEQNIRFAVVLLTRAAQKGKLGYYHSATKDKYERYVEKVNDVLSSAGLERNFR